MRHLTEMMIVDFIPTSVPAGTIQDMAKRLSKHPDMKGVPLSKCQEIMARTFGHASFHDLKQRKPPNPLDYALHDAGAGTRALLYTFLADQLEAKIPVYYALQDIEASARRAGQHPLAALIQALVVKIKDGHSLGDSLWQLGGDAVGEEAFLLETMERGGFIVEVVRKCEKIARKKAGVSDLNALFGGVS